VRCLDHWGSGGGALCKQWAHGDEARGRDHPLWPLISTLEIQLLRHRLDEFLFHKKGTRRIANGIENMPSVVLKVLVTDFESFPKILSAKDVWGDGSSRLGNSGRITPTCSVL
jgi:hypothetical protein